MQFSTEMLVFVFTSKNRPRVHMSPTEGCGQFMANSVWLTSKFLVKVFRQMDGWTWFLILCPPILFEDVGNNNKTWMLDHHSEVNNRYLYVCRIALKMQSTCVYMCMTSGHYTLF